MQSRRRKRDFSPKRSACGERPDPSEQATPSTSRNDLERLAGEQRGLVTALQLRDVSASDIQTVVREKKAAYVRSGSRELALVFPALLAPVSRPWGPVSRSLHLTVPLPAPAATAILLNAWQPCFESILSLEQSDGNFFAALELGGARLVVTGSVANNGCRIYVVPGCELPSFLSQLVWQLPVPTLWCQCAPGKRKSLAYCLAQPCACIAL